MLDVLQAFSTSEPALSSAEITSKLGLAASTVRRILDVLERRGFVRQDPVSGRFSPFVEIVRLAATAVQGNDLLTASRQALDTLRDRTGENVQLTVLVDGEVVFVDRRESPQLIKIFSPTGFRRSPWDGRASGQVLLAWLPDPEIHRLLPPAHAWPRLNANRAITQEDFLGRLAQVREQGYAINDEHTEKDVWAVAAPIRDHTRQVIAAVSVPVLKSRASDADRVEQLIEATISTGRDISARLNYFE
jgi:DNA-binding IclR family transcriptional regulator